MQPRPDVKPHVLQRWVALLWIGTVLYVYAAFINANFQHGMIGDFLAAFFASLTAAYLQ